MLDIKIYTFLKVVELKNYTKAAAVLNLTQPAVTQHIKKLEDHYQCKLIEIIGKAVHLTPEGQALYHYANFQMANEAQLIDQIEHVANPIKIGATLSVADYYLPKHLGAYLNQHKESVAVTVKNTQLILEMLLNNTLYCAFIEGIFDKTVFAYKEFCVTRFLPVVRKGHPLEQGQVSLADTYQYPLVLREKGSGTREIYENYLYQNNDSIQSLLKVHEISSFGMIKKILRATDAISFMYEEVARQEVERGELDFLSLENYEINRPLYFIYPKHSLLKDKIECFYQELMGEELLPSKETNGNETTY